GVNRTFLLCANRTLLFCGDRTMVLWGPGDYGPWERTVYRHNGNEMGVALLDLHFLGTSELRGCESLYDFSSFLTIFSLSRGLGRGEEATDGTISGTR